MNQTLHILPLRLVPYSDRSSILSAYTRELGSAAFAVPAKQRALFMPLTPLEAEASVKPGRDVHTLRNPRALLPLHTIMMSPVRTSVTMFLTEVLQNILRQSEAEALTFDFLVESVAKLNDEQVSPANFPLTFLVQLAKILGIAPDVSEYGPGKIFDMVDACFRTSMPLHGRALSVAESTAAERLCRITWGNMSRFVFTRGERASALDRVLEYYTLHYANLSDLKSLTVLRAL